METREIDSKPWRIGLFTYRDLGEGKYEIGLDVPIKFTKKHQKEIEEYTRDVFGDVQFKVIGEDMVATKKFIIQKVEENG